MCIGFAFGFLLKTLYIKSFFYLSGPWPKGVCPGRYNAPPRMNTCEFAAGRRAPPCAAGRRCEFAAVRRPPAAPLAHFH